jgi:hypothetical protein
LVKRFFFNHFDGHMGLLRTIKISVNSMFKTGLLFL